MTTAPTTHSVGIERLRELYSMMRGIPARLIGLHSWRWSLEGFRHEATSEALFSAARIFATTGEHDCGTTACAVGWACDYPPFQAQGLSYEDRSPVFKSHDGEYAENWNAVSTFFGLSYSESVFIFSKERNQIPWLNLGNHHSTAGVPDKELVLTRIRMYLVHKGVITQERSNFLALEETLP
jgi:hypothetical protein